jgi:serine/threonine-protein kinase
MTSDIYSLGAILYELLAGRPPFEADGVPALLKKIAEEEPVPPSRQGRGLQSASSHDDKAAEHSNPTSTAPAKRPEGRDPVPRDLEVICLKCLAKEPARRYATAQELANDLRRWLAGEPILARETNAIEKLWLASTALLTSCGCRQSSSALPIGSRL